MGDNVFTNTDKAKPEQVSAASIEAQRHLKETHSLSELSALKLAADQPSLKAQITLADARRSAAPKDSSSPEGAAVPNNNPLHLTDLALTSIAKGAWEPLAGTIQLTEQLANKATLNLPGVHKALFSPENLSPSQSSPQYVKYSAEWFINTGGESVGKLPWYYAAAKVMDKVPGFGERAGALSESSLLGMNVKSASASGFIVGALNPTAVQKDGSLTTSLEDRGIQGTIGAVQMGLMTATTGYLGKGVAAGEKALLGKASAATEQTLLGLGEKSVLKTSAQATLQFLKRGSIASVGSIPAGLVAGYANAKITGAKFDVQENIVATATLGFGLSALPMGRAEQAPAPGAEVTAKVRTAAVRKEISTTKDTSTTGENSDSGSAITARARARMRELAQQARVALVGGKPESTFAFNSNDGVPDDAPETTPKEKTFEAKLNTPEEFAKYKDVFDSLMKASKKDGTPADEENFVKAAAKEPWTIRQLREHLTEQNVKTDHIDGLLDRADKAVKDSAMAAERVPPFAKDSFSQGFDLLRNIADAREPQQLDDGIKALRSFVMDSDTVLASKDQLSRAAKKLGGLELQKEFDNALERRYPIAMVHQLPTEQAGRPGNKGEFTEVRSTQAQQFRSVVIQAREVVEGTASKPAAASAEGTAAPENPYVKLRELSRDLDPDLKASLINYASKTNDLRFRALINDVLADPKGENLPNKPIQLSYDPRLESAWDRIENRLAAHPKPGADGQAPSIEDVAQYRNTVFAELNRAEQNSPGVLRLARQYAAQTNNSFEASALDYYFGGTRLDAFDSVKQAKLEAKDAAESRNSYVPKISAPEPVNLETGAMTSAYLDRVIDRLGDKNARKVRQFNNQRPLEKLLDEAPKKFTDHGVTRGKYEGRPDGLVKVTSEPDNSTGLIGGRHTRAEYQNSPDGLIQVDDYADGTRWVREKVGDYPVTQTAFFSNGTEYTYASPDVWSIDFPNGNYIYSYPENEENVAREIKENGTITQVMRDGTVKKVEAPVTEEQPQQQHAENPAQSSVDTLLEQMKSADEERGRLAAADALKSQIGAMDDSQFKTWLDFMREIPPGENTRPPYMKLPGLRSMHILFESGILDNPSTLKAFKTYLEDPVPGQFKLAYPKSLSEIPAKLLTPELLSDIRARFSERHDDGTRVFAPGMPEELQQYFRTNPTEATDSYNKSMSPRISHLFPDTLNERLAALSELGSFKPEVTSRLLELGSQEPRALRDVMKLIKEPRNDIPAMKTLLAETIPNADDIYTVKVMLDSVDAARSAVDNPWVRTKNRDVAMAALAKLTNDLSQDIRLGEKINEIIGTKNAPKTSNMAATLSLIAITKADPNAVAPEQQAAPESTVPVDGSRTSAENGSKREADDVTSTPQTDAAESANGDATLAKPPATEAPTELVEPIKSTVEKLFDELKSNEPYPARLAAAEALKGQLAAMDDAQFQEWLQFARQNSDEVNTRPNYIKMGLRGLGGVFDSNMLDDPAAAKAFKEYLLPPAPGEFKLPYPDVLKSMPISEMPATLLNDIRDRFSARGPSGLVYQDDVPQAMRDYLSANRRIKIDRGKDKVLPPDTLTGRTAVLGQLSAFQPETAARLLEIGAQDPRALADVINLLKEPRNDKPLIQSLLAETIPNADDIYTLKLLVESIDNARQAWRPEDLPIREANQAVALRALTGLTGPTEQDKRLDKDTQEIINKIRFYNRKDKPVPSKLAENLVLAKRTKQNATTAITVTEPASASSPEVLGESAPPPGQSEAHAEPAASEAGLPKRDMTPEELEELTALVQERIAEQYGSVDNLLDQLVGAPDATDQTVQPPLTTSAKAGDQTVQPPLTTRAQTNDGSNSNATGDGGNSGSSQLEKFARRQSKAQRTPGSPKPEVPKPGKQNKQVFTSFADLQKNFPVGTTDTDDAGGKSRNAEKHNRNAQSRRRDQEKQDRRFGDDDDDG